MICFKQGKLLTAKKENLERTVFETNFYSIYSYITIYIYIFVYCSFYSSQKKTLEINTRHPLIKELKTKVDVSTNIFFFMNLVDLNECLL